MIDQLELDEQYKEEIAEISDEELYNRLVRVLYLINEVEQRAESKEKLEEKGMVLAYSHVANDAVLQILNWN